MAEQSLARHIPNLLSALRIVVAPWLAWMVTRHEFLGSAILLGIAAISDGLDGYLARTRNWQSKLGLALDPAADKLLLSTIYLSLGIAGQVPWWLVAMVFGRDLAIVAGAAALRIAKGRREFAPRYLGKVSTAIQLVAAVILLMTPAVLASFRDRVSEPVGLVAWLVGINWVATVAVAGGTVISGLDYLGYMVQELAKSATNPADRRSV